MKIKWREIVLNTRFENFYLGILGGKSLKCPHCPKCKIIDLKRNAQYHLRKHHS